MLQYRSFNEIVDHPGLRIVLVKGMPSPWGQAAKTIFEIKGLDYVAAPWLPGEPNADIVAWGGEASAPIVAWAKEKPINRWIDILYLAERLAPKPSLIPTDATQRAPDDRALARNLRRNGYRLEPATAAVCAGVCVR